ncbi:MAG: tRNA (N(6)-L-threonylcarbamoyladenosine(37)-C(2))-methylthiotransferase MtaB, partial [Solobacterium sp.]|nr:tRNA (N(6)-L-threonylcarbamoyladenosine(37)-C(2))-methylthiotransferase MtaB [Solobacterium sp.]
MMRFSICNLGCKVNAYEAESIASLLEKKGWRRVDFSEEADAALIFTCAVTNTAASKSRKMMHRIRRNYPDTIVAMVGCYAQIDDGMLDQAQIIVGSSHKKQLPEYLDEYLQTRKPVRILDDLKDTPFETLSADGFDSRARAYLKIQDGCNQFCTYCVIPYVRGRERSMEPDLALRDAVRISKDYKEIVLTGIHTGRYGREYGVSLAELMER